MLVAEVRTTFSPIQAAPMPRWLGLALSSTLREWLDDDAYENVFESEATDGIRPIILSPGVIQTGRSRTSWPVVEPGHRIPLQIMLVGRAVDQLDEVMNALRTGLQRDGLRLGRSAVRCEVEFESSRQVHQLVPDELEATLEEPALTVPRLTVQLTTPLRLKYAHQWLDKPTFSQLVAASIRVVLRMANWAGEPFRADTECLVEAAERVTCLKTDFFEFDRVAAASHKNQRQKFNAIWGSATFAEVPLNLIPWLVWGGRFHIGDRRAAGAGGFEITLD